MEKKISVITPSHNTKWLEELYLSLIAQTYSNWEWIILLNGEAQVPKEGIGQLVPEIFKKLGIEIKELWNGDEQIKVVWSHLPPGVCSKVGAIKNEAFKYASGEYLAEVDHDDLLVPTCLEKVVKAFEEDKEVGFVYSDTASWGKDFVPYNPYYGWEHDWRALNELIPSSPITDQVCWMKGFEPDSGAMAYIWYMPDHIRVWKRSVYNQVGGHNPDMAILDDHDLLVRTYLATKMKHIPEPLYIYRIHGENTWLQRNKQIQTGTVDLYKKYSRSLMNMGNEEHIPLMLATRGLAEKHGQELIYHPNIREYFREIWLSAKDGEWIDMRVPDRSNYKAYLLGAINFFTPDTFRELKDFEYKGIRYPFQCVYTGFETDKDGQNWIVAHLRAIKTPGKRYPGWPLNYY